MSGNGNGNGNGNGRLRWAGLALTSALALIAFTVQWGMISAQLNGVEKRLDELVGEAQATRIAIVVIERRVAFLEGAASRASSAREDR